MAVLSLGTLAALSAASPVQAQVWDVTTDWSEVSNPNGPWVYREGNNPLPHVSSWQSVLGGWSLPQPGWAESENENNRLPFWFRSNGSETFAHDWLAGDVVVHTTDPGNGVGNGAANLTWTSPVTGAVDVSGALWFGREIGRSANWTLFLGSTPLLSGALASGDPFSRAAPATVALTGLAVSTGDVLRLQFDTTSAAGDFVGVQMTILSTSTAAAPEPATCALLAAGLLPVTVSLVRKRRSTEA